MFSSRAAADPIPCLIMCGGQSQAIGEAQYDTGRFGPFVTDQRVTMYHQGNLKPFQPLAIDHTYPTHSIEVFAAKDLANLTGRPVRWSKAGTSSVGTQTQVPSGGANWPFLRDGASALGDIFSPVCRCIWMQGRDVGQAGYTQANFESDYRAIRDGIRALIPKSTVWFDWLQLTNQFTGAGSDTLVPLMRAAIANVASEQFSTLSFADSVPGEDGLHYSCDQHFDSVWPAIKASIVATL